MSVFVLSFDKDKNASLLKFTSSFTALPWKDKMSPISDECNLVNKDDINIPTWTTLNEQLDKLAKTFTAMCTTVVHQDAMVFKQKVLDIFAGYVKNKTVADVSSHASQLELHAAALDNANPEREGLLQLAKLTGLLMNGGWMFKDF